MARDAALPDVDLTLPHAPADTAALQALADTYGVGNPIERLLNALALPR